MSKFDGMAYPQLTAVSNQALLPPLWLAVDGYRMSYEYAGQGQEPLVFVHGWANSKDVWEEVIDDLSRDHACVALDLPGMGDSEPRSDGDYRVTSLAESVEDFLDALEPGPVTLFGHSTGGLISLMLARRRPDLVSRLVLVDAVIDGTLGPPFTPGVWLPALSRPVARVGWRWLTGSLKRFLAATRYFLYDPAYSRTIPYFKRLFPYFIHYDPRGMSTLLLSLTKQDMTPYLPDIDVPTLIACGEADRAVPNRQAEKAAHLMPDARLTFIPRAGHVPHQENVGDTLAAFRQFLNEAGNLKEPE